MKPPECLYYICHIDNLNSILELGIYSREEASRRTPNHSDIHDEGVLARRKEATAGSKSLHTYVNLYFQARNAMLYRLICNHERKNFVVLQIAPSVLGEQGVFVSDRNAAVSGVDFLPPQQGLKKIAEKVLKKKYWTDSDETKQRMMAEALIPNHIPPDKIIGIFTYKEGIVQNPTGKISVVAEPGMFFWPTYRMKIGDNISLSQGDMFFSNMQTFTISVNLKGIMGKGLASRTKYQFPDAYVRYQDDCKSQKLKVGKPTLYKRVKCIEEELADDASQLIKENLNGSRWFLFFPTKRHWRDNSRLDDIELSLQWLLKNYQKEDIKSIAIPALGCGLGNLRWEDVGPLMCNYLRQMDIQSCIYLPASQEITDEFKKFLSPAYLLNDDQNLL